MVLIIVSITAVAIILYLWKRETRERNEAIFKSLIEAAPDAMVVVNDKGIIILVNQQTETLFGYQRPELIGQPVEKLIPEELHHKHHEYRKKYNHEPRFRSMGAGLELQGVKKGDVRFPVEISLSPVRTSQGMLVSASVRDITDRKKAEQKFWGLLDAAPDATVIITNTGIIEMINKQTENIFGYTREEMIGQPIEILIPQEIRAKHVGHRNSFIQEAGVREMGVGIELKAVRKDGNQFPVEISLSPIQTEEGMLISASVRDISDRKNAQLALIKLNEELENRVIERTRELNASERRFRALVENNDGIIALLDEKMKVVYRSPSSEHVTGWSSKERETIGSMDQTHPDDLDILQKAISYIFQEPGKVYRLSFRTKHKDGHYLWLEGTIKNMLHDPIVKAIITNFQDITERRRSENKIKETQVLLRSGIEIADMNIFSVDSNFRYLYFNTTHRNSMSSLYKITPETGMSLLDCMTKREDRNIAQKNIQLALDGKAHILIAEFGDVDRHYYESRYNPILNEKNDIIGASIFSVNITARIKAEQALRKSESDLEEKVKLRTEQLENSHKEMEAFTYSVSHDLRAPLRGIIGFTTILEEEYSSKFDNEGRRLTSVIRNNTLKMGKLIDELLNFSRLGKSELLKSNVNMSQVVNEIIESTNAGNVHWEITNLPSVGCDLNTIRQVWVNLISNAVKYSAKSLSPEITIGHYREDKEDVFFVKDNGAGFDEKYKTKLFKIFQRLHSTREFEGTGVGLAIIEKIISKHDGKVWATGEVDKGAAFYFSLPVL